MIDFALTEDQRALRDMARKFTREQIIPIAPQCDEEGKFPMDLAAQAYELGLVNLSIPPEYGGSGLSLLDSLIVYEELAYGCMGITTSLLTNELALTPIILFGTEEQKQKFIAPLCAERKFASFALTEPDAGSDAAAVRTSYTKTDGGYLINGQKCFITNATIADFYVVFTSGGGAARRRVSVFLVPRDAKGVSVGKKENKLGQRASETASVFFEDVEIPAENLLGREGHGFRVAMQTFDYTRPAIAIGAVGLARRAFEEALRYANEREQFGQPIYQNQAVLFMIVEMAKHIEAARLMTWKAAWALENGQNASLEASACKAYAADTAMQITTDAVQVFGGYGYCKEYPVEKLMRDCKLMQIYEGTSQIQNLVVGRELQKRQNAGLLY